MGGGNRRKSDASLKKQIQIQKEKERDRERESAKQKAKEAKSAVVVAPVVQPDPVGITSPVEQIIVQFEELIQESAQVHQEIDLVNSDWAQQLPTEEEVQLEDLDEKLVGDKNPDKELAVFGQFLKDQDILKRLEADIVVGQEEIEAQMAKQQQEALQAFQEAEELHQHERELQVAEMQAMQLTDHFFGNGSGDNVLPNTNPNDMKPEDFKCLCMEHDEFTYVHNHLQKQVLDNREALKELAWTVKQISDSFKGFQIQNADLISSYNALVAKLGSIPPTVKSTEVFRTLVDSAPVQMRVVPVATKKSGGLGFKY